MSTNLFAALCLGFFGFWLASLAQDICSFALSCFAQERRRNVLDVDVEKSFYTWISACTLFLTAFMAFRRAETLGKGAKHFRQWLLIAVIFVYLSADESLTAHERLVGLGELMVVPTGYFHFAWTAPALVLVALVVLSLITLVLDLPPRQRRLAVGSAALFVGGAVGMEMVGGRMLELHGRESLPYRISVSLEEGMEGLGILTFLRMLIGLERTARTA